MTASTRAVLLAAFSIGAMLVGAELMITAVALPAIVNDIAGWTELRRASWIVNGYLLAYIAAMPLAGRAADRYGLPRLLIGGLLIFAAGRSWRAPPRASTGSSPRGSCRASVAAPSCPWRRPAPATCTRATRARGRSGWSVRRRSWAWHWGPSSAPSS